MSQAFLNGIRSMTNFGQADVRNATQRSADQSSGYSGNPGTVYNMPQRGPTGQPTAQRPQYIMPTKPAYAQNQGSPTDAQLYAAQQQNNPNTSVFGSRVSQYAPPDVSGITQQLQNVQGGPASTGLSSYVAPQFNANPVGPTQTQGSFMPHLDVNGNPMPLTQQQRLQLGSSGSSMGYRAPVRLRPIAQN